MSAGSLGRRLVLTSFGESHGKCVGAVLAGCPAGLALGEGDVQEMLDLRRPGLSAVSTARKEGDAVEMLSGVYRGRTTGAPIAMLVRNEDQRPGAYGETASKVRPGHSDYPAMVRYGGFNDHRGGGHFSGRLTATHVMGGAVARKLLREALGVATRSYTVRIGDVAADGPGGKGGRLWTRRPPPASAVYSNEVRCPDAAAAARMREAVLAAKKGGDSLGGVVESVTTGLPAGVGEPMFGSLESDVSRALYSIPSVKGVEFGSGFAGSLRRGSENNDPYAVRSGRIVTATNNAGGILGGLSTGMPLVLRAAFKPASSISLPQRTVDARARRPAVLRVGGRHDPCVVPRAPPVVDCMVSLVLADHALTGGFIGAVL